MHFTGPNEALQLFGVPYGRKLDEPVCDSSRAFDDFTQQQCWTLLRIEIVSEASLREQVASELRYLILRDPDGAGRAIKESLESPPQWKLVDWLADRESSTERWMRFVYIE